MIPPYGLITGVVVRCRPIGVLKMDDQAGGDSKLLSVPVDDLKNLNRRVKGLRDVPKTMTRQIAHFFEHYKDLEKGEWVKVIGWAGPEDAKREILDSAARYRKEKKKKRLI